MQLLAIATQHPVEVLTGAYLLINLVIALRSAPTSQERCTIIVQYLEAFFSRISTSKLKSGASTPINTSGRRASKAATNDINFFHICHIW